MSDIARLLARARASMDGAEPWIDKAGGTRLIAALRGELDAAEKVLATVKAHESCGDMWSDDDIGKDTVAYILAVESIRRIAAGLGVVELRK